MDALLSEIRNCTHCEKHLPFAPHPVVFAHPDNEIIIIGQAPGTKVHKSGIPWDDQSGKLLREWMNIDADTFYNNSKIGIIPMGFCYPGKGKSGDLPPRPECAPLWHEKLFAQLPNIKLVLLIGMYAQRHYLREQAKPTLTETVQNFEAYLPLYLPLPHPSPRNRIWLKRNDWFGKSVIPILKQKIETIL